MLEKIEEDYLDETCRVFMSNGIKLIGTIMEVGEDYICLSVPNSNHSQVISKSGINSIMLAGEWE